MPAYPTKPHPETDCEKIRPLLSSLADGAATPDEAARAEAHMAACAACTSYLAFLRTTSFVFQRSLETPSPSLFDRIAQATYDAPKVPTWRERIAAWFNPAPTRLALGTALAAAIVGVLIVPRAGELSNGTQAAIERDAANRASSTPSVANNSAAGTANGTSVPSSNGNTSGSESSASPNRQLSAAENAGFRVASIWDSQKAKAARPVSVPRRTGDSTTVRSHSSSSSAAETAVKPPVSPATNVSPPASMPNRTMESPAAPRLTARTMAPEAIERTTRSASATPLLSSATSTPPSTAIADDPTTVITRPRTGITASAANTSGRVDHSTTTAAAEPTPSKLPLPEPKTTGKGFTLAGAKTGQPDKGWAVAPKSLVTGRNAQSFLTVVETSTKTN
jgi:anti-sigma factor RsiW